MTALQCDAALLVSASPVFPLTFPFTFGPTATATRSAVVDAALDIDAVVASELALAASAGASLSVGATLTASQILAASANASLVIVDDPEAEAVGGINTVEIDAHLTVTASRSSSVKFSAELSATLHEVATTVAGFTRHVFASAARSVTVTPAALLNLHGYFAAAKLITATATDNLKLSGGMSAALPVTATEFASFGKHYSVDAALLISTYGVFPYIFPFVFEQSLDTISRGQSVNAAETISVSSSGSGTRGVLIDAHLEVTADIVTGGISGGEHPVDGFHEITVIPLAGMTRNQFVDSVPVGVTVAIDADIRQDSLADAELDLDLTADANLLLSGLVDAPRAIDVDTEALINQDGLADGALIIESSPDGAITKGRLIDASLTENLTWQVLSNLTYLVDAPLTVYAVFSVTTPSPMNFFPFYMR